MMMLDEDTQKKEKRSHRLTRLRRKISASIATINHKKPTILFRYAATTLISIVLLFIIIKPVFITILSLTRPPPNSSLSLSEFVNTDGTNPSSTSSYDLAKHQSYGFFHQTPQDEWKLLQIRVRDHVTHKFPNYPLALNPEAEEVLHIHENIPQVRRRTRHYITMKDMPIRYKSWYMNNYDPNFSCRFEQRVGGNGNGDGPKWVCDPHRLIQISQERRAVNPNQPGCIVYSIGSNGDYTFETGLQRLIGVNTCDIHVFDMGDYGKDMPKELKATYHQWGLHNKSTSAMENSEFKTLKETVRLLGHDQLDSNTIDIFKIDCEGCEWLTHDEWFDKSVPHLQQILVEVHRAPKDHVLQFFDGMANQGYVNFHKESNIEFEPSCLEYGFLKLRKEFFLPKVEKESNYYDYIDDDVVTDDILPQKMRMNDYDE